MPAGLSFAEQIPAIAQAAWCFQRRIDRATKRFDAAAAQPFTAAREVFPVSMPDD